MTTHHEVMRQGDLEAENAKLKQMMVDGVTIQQYIDLDNEVDELRRKLAAAETRLSRNPKPLGYIPADAIHQLEPPALILNNLPIYTYHGENTVPIYTEAPAAPQAQHLSDSKLMMVTTAYEQGVGKGIQRRDCNPYSEGCDEHRAWALGYEEGASKPAWVLSCEEGASTQYPISDRECMKLWKSARAVHESPSAYAWCMPYEFYLQGLRDGEAAHGIGEKQ